MEPRVAVLASGQGTNLQALLDDPSVGPLVAVVLTDRREAAALERATSRGVAGRFVDPAGTADRPAYGRLLASALEEHGATHVALAGFMRILDRALVRRFGARMLNVHPSLLPAFPGAHPVRDALAWGAKVTGATVHFVDEEVDHGPIVFQEAVEVRPDDDEASLHARIQRVEHRLYPAAVRLLVQGRLSIHGRTVRLAAAVST